MVWHSMPISEVLKALNTSEEGLKEADAVERLSKYGFNELISRKKSVINLFVKQFTNFLVLILIIATVVAALLGELVDSIAILIIVLLMGVSGFLQEYRAEKAVEALKKLTTPEVKVVREGKVVVIPSTHLVPGDIVLLSEGDKVPADLRLIESEDLRVDESPLTGESEPVLKDHSKVLPVDTELHSRVNMVFMGTYVYSGKGKGVVVATGMKTELGKIAEKLAEVKEKKTLLEEELDRFGRRLGLVLIGISAVVFITSLIHVHMAVIDALLLSIALAVAAIPEGLPAIVTSVLAIGAYRMSKKNVIVRELGAIETLGACDVIATDKTGTITKGEMTVKKVWIGFKEFEVSGQGYEPKGEVLLNNEVVYVNEVKTLSEFLALHTKNDVELTFTDGLWRVKGSPTEGSALVLTYKVLGKDYVDKLDTKLVKTYPFDRFRKRKTTVHSLGSRFLIVSSGAPELLLNISSKLRLNGVEVPLDEGLKERIRNYVDSIASQGFRTYGVAYKIVDDFKKDSEVEEVEKNLTFFAVLGIVDPPREGVREAIEELRKAGIKVIMITGDHKLTAEAVGRMIGLENGEVLEGADLDRMSDEELSSIVEKVSIYARTTPEHKRRIVKALQSKGHVVAMTGDGVNDALALKEADLGIAMGLRGTEVAKEVSKLVIRDDNFVTIATAVKEGRIIFENLKKPINYLLPANLGEVSTILFAELAGFQTPLTPIQLLWINVTTDALPALALSMEPPEPDIMLRPPRKRNTSFLTTRKLIYFTLLGALIGITNLTIFSWGLNVLGERIARTLVYMAIGMSEFARALASRSEVRSFLYRPFNLWIIPSVIASLTLLLITVYVEPLQQIFQTTSITPELLYIPLIASLPILLIDEFRKKFRLKI